MSIRNEQIKAAVYLGYPVFSIDDGAERTLDGPPLDVNENKSYRVYWPSGVIEYPGVPVQMEMFGQPFRDSLNKMVYRTGSKAAQAVAQKSDEPIDTLVADNKRLLTENYKLREALLKIFAEVKKIIS